MQGRSLMHLSLSGEVIVHVHVQFTNVHLQVQLSHQL